MPDAIYLSIYPAQYLVPIRNQNTQIIVCDERIVTVYYQAPLTSFVPAACSAA